MNEDLKKLQEKIVQKRKIFSESQKKVTKLEKNLKVAKKENNNAFNDLCKSEEEFLITKHNLTLGETVLKDNDTEYLLMGFDYNMAVIVSPKNKNGQWSKRQFTLGLYDFEKGGLIQNFMEIKL